ncbi:MAG: MFS transporter [Methanospirillum sp.]
MHAAAPRQPAARTGWAYKWIALLITSLGTLGGVLNGSTLIIALPTIMIALNTTLVGVMIPLVVYLLVTTITAPAWGRIADLYGRKRLYLAGLVLFTLGSLLCGFSLDIVQLTGFRILQALGGSILIANSTIIITDAFPRGELGRANGLLSMIMAAAFVVGPILGGVLTLVDWRLNFFFNLPIGLLALYLGARHLREPALPKLHGGFDFTGMGLFTIAVLSLIVYVGVGFIPGLLSPEMLAVLALFLASLVLFVRRETRIANPLIDLSLFRIRIVAFGQLSAFLNAIARGAVMVLLILYFQGVRGLDPLTSSILIAPLAIGLVIMGPIGGILSDRYGSRAISTIGLVLSLVGLAGLALIRYDTPYPWIALPLFVNGIGSGLFQSPNTSAVMAAVPLERRGITSSVRALLNNLGMVISMAIATPVLLGSVPMDEMMEMFVIGGTSMPVEVQQAMTGGIALAFVVSAFLTLPAVVASALRGTENRALDAERDGGVGA